MKPGDIITCHDASCCPELKVGGRYTFSGMFGDRVRLAEFPGESFFAWRFEPPVAAPTAPPVYLASGNPQRILSDCRKAAIKAGWMLSTWDEFASTARACLTPDATVEEHATFLRVVEERFAVTRGKGFDADPASWRGAEVTP